MTLVTCLTTVIKTIIAIESSHIMPQLMTATTEISVPIVIVKTRITCMCIAKKYYTENAITPFFFNFTKHSPGDQALKSFELINNLKSSILSSLFSGTVNACIGELFIQSCIHISLEIQLKRVSLIYFTCT